MQLRLLEPQSVIKTIGWSFISTGPKKKTDYNLINHYSKPFAVSSMSRMILNYEEPDS